MEANGEYNNFISDRTLSKIGFWSGLIAFVYFYPNFSNKLLLIATPWIITAPLPMLMLSLLFKKLKR